MKIIFGSRRIFKERGIDEQPTIHEGVAARIIEQRGGISERCEINRQIRSDNVLLRELKAIVQDLADKIKNSVKNIAARLETLRGRLIMIQYQFNFNTGRSKELKAATNTVSHELDETPPLKKSVRNILLKKHSQAMDANKVKKYEYER